jgi:protein-S-isoprenylcysteine O-methyltransferase Ste14
MRATDFEFRWRFVLFGLCFGAGFEAYAFDRHGLAAWLGGLTGSGGRPWLALGAGLVIAAAALRTWATAYLRTDVVHDLSLHTGKLVADGPYRHCRNPLYLGGVLLAVGFGLFASPLGFAIMVGGILLLNMRLIGREEADLRAGHDASFEAFCRAVPRLGFALAPRLPAGGGTPRWPQAFLGESWIWLMAAGAVLFVATLNRAVFVGATELSLALYVVMLLVLKARRGRAA